MADSTPVRLVYHFDDGDTSDLALGTIDRNGLITVETVAEGQEEMVGTLVAELNETSRIYVRGMTDGPEGETGRMTKTAIERGTPQFLEAFSENCLRFYSVEVRFDPAVLASDSSGLDWPDTVPPSAEDDPIEPSGAYDESDDGEPSPYTS